MLRSISLIILASLFLSGCEPSEEEQEKADLINDTAKEYWEHKK